MLTNNCSYMLESVHTSLNFLILQPTVKPLQLHTFWNYDF